MTAPNGSQAVEAGHLPPQNVEAEQRVLGALLLDGAMVAPVMEVLRPEHFYRMSHRAIYEAMLDLFDRTVPVDILTLVDSLKKMGKLDVAGGPEYVATLADDVSSAKRAVTYAKLVRNAAILRNLIHTSGAIAERAFSTSEDVDGLVDDAERAILEISSDRHQQNIGSMRDIIKTTFPYLEELYERKELVTGVPTGFNDFDRMSAGLQAGELTIAAGRPSMGKTAFALCIAEHAAISAKVPVAFFSLEMNARHLAIRMMCGRAGVNSRQLMTGFMPSNGWPLLIRAAGELSEAPFFVDDSADLTVFDIKAKCRRLQAESGLGFVVVDYLQLLSHRGRRNESRQVEISEISRGLKALAKELNVPVLALSQLSRQAETREGKRPTLADLRESGAIEQDADLVALLYREDYYDPNSPSKGIATIIIAKQRNGPTGDISLQFSPEQARFSNLDTFHERVSPQPVDGYTEEEGVNF